MNPIEEIKRKLDIVEFIGSHITLKKAGRNFKANCPFHQEKSASFVVSPERQIWHCFGACQEGGDVIRFLMKWENIPFVEALQELAKRTGVKLDTFDIQDSQWKKKEALIRVNNSAKDFYHYILTQSEIGKKAREYLAARNINEKIIETFQLGYAPQSWDSLIKFLIKKSFAQADLKDTGLTVTGKNNSLYDRFRGRIMFPINDTRGNNIGFSGRVLVEEDGKDGAKYVNTPETPLYHKRESLFGIHLAKDAIKKEGNVFLVEGEFDAISMYQSGVKNVVAIKGSAVTRDQLQLLKRLTDNVTLALDADAAGEEAVRRSIYEAEQLDVNLQIVQFDFAKDPDEAIQKDLKRFKKAVDNPVPIFDYMFDLLQTKHNIKDPFGKKKLSDEYLTIIRSIKNPIVQSHYVKKLATLLEVGERTIERELEKVRQKKYKTSTKSMLAQPKDQEQRELKIQKYFLSILLQSDLSDDEFSQIKELLEPQEFSTPAFQNLYEQVMLQRKGDFPAQLNDQLKSVYDELYLYASYEAEFSHESKEKLAFEIKKNHFKRMISEVLTNKELTENQKKNLKEYGEQLKEVEKKALTL